MAGHIIFIPEIKWLLILFFLHGYIIYRVSFKYQN